jgi:hypothetical protein
MCGEMCDENDLKSAIQEIGFSTMSAPLRCALSEHDFVPKKKWLSLFALYIHLIKCHMTIFSQNSGWH